MLKHFKGSIIFTVVALLLAAVVGFVETGLLIPTLQMVFITAVLGVMETSLSLDNAIVNSKILEDMDEKWVDRFLSWGIIIAVFGMRIVFPLAIVCIAGQVSPWEAGKIALFDHERYETIVTGAHVGIAGFGGAFLLLVALNFFISDEKEHHWLPFIEKPVAALGGIKGAAYGVAIVILGIAAYFAGPDWKTFGLSAFVGVVTYAAVNAFSDYVESKNEAKVNLGGQVAKAGFASFLYLEVLDASFSFDGVIGAFAITNDIVIIALGLGIGAMFVRSMTVFLTKGGHMSDYRYLEHGAFWAIIALAAIMLSVHVEVPEYITGLIGVALIAAAYFHSKAHRKAHPEEYLDDEDGEAVLPSGEVVAGA
jgi:hypothetical protein